MHVSEFQKLMRDLYFQNDKTRGIHRTTLWLGEELGELMHELKKSPDKMDYHAISEEMADICAWVGSLANLLEIDLEAALKAKYPGECGRCHHNPCKCEKDLP